MKKEQPDSGFTLVELLVSLAVLALMATYAVTMLQRFADIRRVEIVTADRETLVLARQHLRSVIGGMRGTFDAKGLPDNRLLFEGAPDHIKLSNILDDRLEFGRLYVLAYSLKNNSLHLSHSSVTAVSDVGSKDVNLIRNIKSVAFTYYGIKPEGNKGQWYNDWKGTTLPKLIKVDVTFTDSREAIWDPLIVAVATSVP